MQKATPRQGTRSINFHQHGRFLPLEVLGTGVHQAIVLASVATVAEKKVICLEEPELHFHPELQRQLMHYLYNETNNQYFVTTHSAHIMDAVPCSILHVAMEQGNSIVTAPVTSNDRRNICHRLGYRPSDLLQANCILWVEGPSDRIYLNHWIKAFDNSLEEGWHYSIMFYGGRLLSNLSADDDKLFDEFVHLLPISRFLVVIIDSDRRVASDSINSTKQRIQKEVTDAGGFVWVTAGREVENYLSLKSRRRAVLNVHKSARSLISEQYPQDIYQNGLAYIDEKGDIKGKRFDKIRIAQEITQEAAQLDILDLEERMAELVRYIRRANRLEV